MNKPQFSAEKRQSVIAAVAAACTVTRHVQHATGRIAQHTKEDHSPVTIADYASQAVIAERLRALEPDLRLVGEEDADALRASGQDTLRQAVTDAVQEVWETADTEQILDAIDVGNHDASAARYWTLDPIDGTKGFLRGGQYAVSLALIENGEVIFGILGCPNLGFDSNLPVDQAAQQGSLFYASRGAGAWCLPVADPTSPPVRVEVRQQAALETVRVCESVEAGHSRLDDTARIVRHLGIAGAPVRLDSQCKYAVVARGQADAYLRLPTQRAYVEKIWDHAAGKLVAEEAGARVSDIRGNPLDFSRGALLSNNRGVVCSAPSVHAALIETIATLNLFPD